VSLSVVIPVYNEGGQVEGTIRELHQVLRDPAIGEYEIIVVDDGSTDGTSRILEEHHEALGIQLISHGHNRGYGAALKTGIRRCRHEVVAITDADGTYPNQEIPRLYREIEACDMVVGARTGKNVQIPLVRRPAKWMLNRLAEYLADTPIPDLNSGLRLFRKAEAMAMFNILPSGFSFTTTITLAMLTTDRQVRFLPIDYLKRTGRSKIRPIHDTLNFLQLILRTVLYFNPLRVFLPIAIFFLLASIGVFVYSALALEKILDTTVVILFVAFVQMLSIGMLADIVDKRNRN
jgi:glycosyltransferase involved in cell wall biosynthesis